MRQMQRCLNPNIQEEDKKEVLKLLDVGIVYLISDSKQVSPIKLCLKRQGLQLILTIRVSFYLHAFPQGGKCVLTIGSLTLLQRNIPFACHSQTSCYIEWLAIHITIFQMGIVVTTRLRSLLKIRRKPHSPAHLEHLTIDERHSVFVMPQLLSKGVCQGSSVTWSKIILKSLQTISPFFCNRFDHCLVNLKKVL